MNKLKQLLKLVGRLSLKGIYINFKYLPFSKAIKFPILVSRHVLLKNLSGSIVLPDQVYTAMVQIGFGEVNLFDKRRSKSILEIKGRLEIKGKTNINHGSKIIVGENGVLRLGENFIVMAETGIIANKSVTFGDNCLLSWDNLIMDTDYHKIYNSKDELINADRDIVIGDGVWVGCRCTILKGSKIADKAIIAAGSTVSGRLATPAAIYGGQTASVIKEQVRWEP